MSLTFAYRRFRSDRREYGLGKALWWRLVLYPYYDVRWFGVRVWRATRLAWRDFRANESSENKQLFVLMDWQFSEMISAFKDDSYHDHVEDIRRVRIARECVRRLLADDYFEIAEKRFPARDIRWARRSDALAKADVTMLAQQMLHVQEWDT